MLNPKIKFVETPGIDLPILTVYLAGRISGDKITKCLEWRATIINHYKNYYRKGAYPIVFLDALNSKEADSIDKLGLTSVIPPNLIYDKDILSVQKADVIVANLDDYMEDGIEDIILRDEEVFDDSMNFKEAFFRLHDVIKNRRENYGTISEVSIAMYLQKPIILIVPNNRREIYEKHPFSKRASVIVGSVDELLEKKWLQILYKSIAGAIY